MKDIKIVLFYNGEDVTLFVKAHSVEEVSKTLRGARETGYYYNFPEEGGAMLIGSDVIRNSIIDITEWDGTV